MPAPLDVTSSPAFLDALGTAPDAEIAERFGVSPQTVHAYRKRHGIDSFRQHTKGDRIERYLYRHGHLSDSEIARRVGVSVKAVRKRRHARGEVSPASPSHPSKIKADTDAVFEVYRRMGGALPRQPFGPYLRMFVDATQDAYVSGVGSREYAWKKWTREARKYLKAHDKPTRAPGRQLFDAQIVLFAVEAVWGPYT